MTVRVELAYFFHEHFGGLESGDFVFGDNDGCVFGDVASGFFGANFDDEAAEAAQINVFAVGEGIFNNFHEFLWNRRNEWSKAKSM